MSGERRLGLLGGTFDPIHYGHLDAAEAAQRALALDEMRFIPSHMPPHRAQEPVASPFHRFALAALAIAGRPGFRLSDMELQRDGRTYTVDTLEALHRQGWSGTQLFFILGSDAFAEIATWKRYPEVLDAANFVVIARPGLSMDEALAKVPSLRPRTCGPTTFGAAGLETRIIVVEAHTRDVSSTMIRQRIQAALPIDDLVPTAVAHHIATHKLYGAVDHLHGESTGSFH